MEHPPKNWTPEDSERETEKVQETRRYSRLSPPEQRKVADLVARKLRGKAGVEAEFDPEKFIKHTVIDFFEHGPENVTIEGYRAILKVDNDYVFVGGKASVYRSLTELCTEELVDTATLLRLRVALWDELSPVTLTSMGATGSDTIKGVWHKPDDLLKEEAENRAEILNKIESRIRTENPAYALTKKELAQGTGRFGERVVSIAQKDLTHAVELEVLRRHIERTLPPPTSLEVRQYLEGARGYDEENPYHTGIVERRNEPKIATLPRTLLFEVKKQHELILAAVRKLIAQGKLKAPVDAETFVEYAVLEWAEHTDPYGALRPESPYLGVWKIRDGYALVDESHPTQFVRTYKTLAELARDGLDAGMRKNLKQTLRKLTYDEKRGNAKRWVYAGRGAAHAAYLHDLGELGDAL